MAPITPGNRKVVDMGPALWLQFSQFGGLVERTLGFRFKSLDWILPPPQ